MVVVQTLETGQDVSPKRWHLSQQITLDSVWETVTFIAQPLECLTSPQAQYTACICQRITCTSELADLVYVMFQRDILLNWQLWRSTSVWVWILMVCHTAHLDTSVLNSAGQMCNYQALWMETDVSWTLILTWERDSVTEWKKGPLLSEVLLLVLSYLSVCPSVWTNPPPHQSPNGHIFWNFIFEAFPKIWREHSVLV